MKIFEQIKELLTNKLHRSSRGSLQHQKVQLNSREEKQASLSARAATGRLIYANSPYIPAVHPPLHSVTAQESPVLLFFHLTPRAA